MTTTSEARSLPFFTDLQGLPLQGGSIYIGQAGLDPRAYPQAIYSTVNGNVAVAQPVRTTNGRAVSGGSQIHLYTSVPYSIIVEDASGRSVYASLNETDASLLLQGSSAVQSASTISDLKARDGQLTNQVFLSGYGLYVANHSDVTSPEDIPFTIVGNDGTRYVLTNQFVITPYLRATQPAVTEYDGSYIGYNGNVTVMTNKGAGGFAFLGVNEGGTETLRVTFGANGDVSGHNFLANGGVLYLDTAADRFLQWDGNNYILANAPLMVQASPVITANTFMSYLQSALASNQLGNGVGAVALGSSASESPVLPGSWSMTTSHADTAYLWVRVA